MAPVTEQTLNRVSLVAQARRIRFIAKGSVRNVAQAARTFLSPPLRRASAELRQKHIVHHLPPFGMRNACRPSDRFGKNVYGLSGLEHARNKGLYYTTCRFQCYFDGSGDSTKYR